MPGLDELVAHARRSIDAAWKHEPKLPDAARIEGGELSASDKVRHLLHNMASMPRTVYLEAGIWIGSSLICSLLGNENHVDRAYAIDNWKLSPRPYPDDIARRQFADNRQNHLSQYCDKLTVFDEDVNTFDVAKIDWPVNLFYFDADHERTAEGVLRFMPTLADQCIIMLDDWNIFGIDRQWREAEKQMPFDVVKEWILPNSRRRDAELWWCGFYVAVLNRKATV